MLKLKKLLFTPTGKLKKVCRSECSLKEYNKEVYALVLEVTSFLKQTASLPERLFCIKNKIVEPTTCQSCSRQVKFSISRNRYYLYCGDGCTSACAKQAIRCKRENTNLKKYGYRNPTQNPTVYNKIKKTNMVRYGVDNPVKNKKVQEKIKNTNLKRYGNASPLGNKQIKEKSKNTLLKKYGVDNISKVPEIKEKKKQTLIKNYQVTAPMHSEIIRNKLKSTLQRKYGIDNISQKHLDIKVLALRSDKVRYRNLLIKLHHSWKWSLAKIAKLLGIYDTTVGVDLKNLGIEVRYHPQPSSIGEEELFLFIQGLVTDSTAILKNDRVVLEGKELDIYLPTRNIAVEFNGMYWHSYNKLETMAEKKNHQNKSLVCKEKEIQLFTVFESDWVNPQKRDIWKSILKNKLGYCTTKVFARKCQKASISYKEFKDFCNLNHLQGACRSSVYLGLFYKTELISVMSFNKYNKIKESELTRFCSKLNTVVVGGASKLFKYYLNNYYNLETIYTFADLRYSYGNLYKKLGFRKVSLSNPCYYYCKHTHIYHRRNFQRKNLPNILGEAFNPELSESANIFNNTKFRRIWDCGKIKFVFKPN